MRGLWLTLKRLSGFIAAFVAVFAINCAFSLVGGRLDFDQVSLIARGVVSLMTTFLVGMALDWRDVRSAASGSVLGLLLAVLAVMAEQLWAFMDGVYDSAYVVSAGLRALLAYGLAGAIIGASRKDPVSDNPVSDKKDETSANKDEP